MFTVYVLFSPGHKKIYIGFTSDMDARILSHNQLANKGHTVKFRPWNICHTETFLSKQLAMKREKELKTAAGRSWIWETI